MTEWAPKALVEAAAYRHRSARLISAFGIRPSIHISHRAAEKLERPIHVCQRSKVRQQRVACATGSTAILLRASQLTPAQEFREARDWLKQHKHDPFLWVMIVMTLTMFTFNFGNLAIFSSAFLPADAIRAFGQVASNVDLGVGSAKIPCKLPRGTYLFGYDLVRMQNGIRTGRIGRICRDILNREWVRALDGEIR